MVELLSSGEPNSEQVHQAHVAMIHQRPTNLLHSRRNQRLFHMFRLFRLTNNNNEPWDPLYHSPPAQKAKKNEPESLVKNWM